MNLALQALRDLPSTKDQADRFAHLLIQEVKTGGTDPLKLRIFLKHFERVISEVNAACEEDILREAEKYGTSFEMMDAQIQIKENGARFAYDKTGDPVIYSLQAELEKIQKKLKEREKFLQSLPEEGQTVMDEATGEVIRIVRPYKKGGKTGLAITIKGGKE